jgi:ketosteroid isomerase-like protein
MTLYLVRLLTAVFVPGVCVVGLANAQTQGGHADRAATQTEVADRTLLESTTQAWTKAFNARRVDALIALATDDVVLLDPSLPPVTGAAAHAAWKQAVGAARGQITNVSKEIVIAGDIAWRIGALSLSGPTGEVLSSGPSLEIWKRTQSGWRLHRQMSSSILPQPKLLSRPLPSEPVLDRPAN